jgi:Tol biopolymer transport system component
MGGRRMANRWQFRSAGIRAGSPFTRCAWMMEGCVSSRVRPTKLRSARDRFRLFPSRAAIQFPHYSPDGSKIAFMRRLPDVKLLMVMAADGGTPIEVLRSSNPFNYAWAVDGRSIVCSLNSEAGVASMVRVRLPHGKPEPLGLPEAEAGNSSLAVAERGDRLAFVVRSQRSKIWRYDFDSAASPHPVAEADGMQVAPAISPNGERLAFASNRDGNFEIYVTRKDGGYPTQLTSFQHGGTGWPKWSPEGRRIAFDARQNGQAHVYVIDAEGGAPRRLTEGGGDAVMPQLSADGAFLYYTRLMKDGTTDIWKVAAAGGVSTRVTSSNAYGVLPSPDGSYLFVGRNSRAELDAIPLAGGAAYSLDGPDNISRMAIAGRGIYEVGPNTASNVAPLILYGFAGKALSKLFLTQGRPMGPVLAISPDEEYALVSQVDDFESKIILRLHFVTQLHGFASALHDLVKRLRFRRARRNLRSGGVVGQFDAGPIDVAWRASVFLNQRVS